MKKCLLLLCLSGFFQLAAQTTQGLIAFYPFEGNLNDATGNTANAGTPAGAMSYLCGVDETAVAFNGTTDRININGPLLDEFNVEDFSLSFYFKSTGADGNQYLLSKRRTDCAGDFAFMIRYRPSNRTLDVTMTETPNKSVSLLTQLDDDQCWYHVALVRDENRIRLYIDGELEKEGVTVGRIDVENDGELILGSTDCPGANETNFNGLMDDLRFYNRPLGINEIRGLYFRPDRIQTPDTLLFLNQALDVRLTSTCGAAFSWSPIDGVSDPSAAEPSITPPAPGSSVYTVQISDDVSSCVAVDSIEINVIDPQDLDCSTVFLPTAFTPNGDDLNDTYGISNPYALQELVSFEIFDRWGGRIFYTDDPFQRWDGSVNGTPLNPGVMLYKVVFRCNGEEKVQTGSVTILR